MSRTKKYEDAVLTTLYIEKKNKEKLMALSEGRVSNYINYLIETKLNKCLTIKEIDVAFYGIISKIETDIISLNTISQEKKNEMLMNLAKLKNIYSQLEPRDWIKIQVKE
ncbi:MAG: hypothetical protein QXL51_01070 [Candidatus Aenigmatarchaeota archaeon]